MRGPVIKNAFNSRECDNNANTSRKHCMYAYATNPCHQFTHAECDMANEKVVPTMERKQQALTTKLA